MSEMILDGRGTGSTLKVNPDGTINVVPVIGITGSNNPAKTLIYDGNGNLGSIVQFIGTGSYVKVLGYDGNGNLTSVGSWV